MHFFFFFNAKNKQKTKEKSNVALAHWACYHGCAKRIHRLRCERGFGHERERDCTTIVRHCIETTTTEREREFWLDLDGGEDLYRVVGETIGQTLYKRGRRTEDPKTMEKKKL